MKSTQTLVAPVSTANMFSVLSESDNSEFVWDSEKSTDLADILAADPETDDGVVQYIQAKQLMQTQVNRKRCAADDKLITSTSGATMPANVLENTHM